MASQSSEAIAKPKPSPVVHPTFAAVVCTVCGAPVGVRGQSPAVRGPDGKLRHKVCPGRRRL